MNGIMLLEHLIEGILAYQLQHILLAQADVDAGNQLFVLVPLTVDVHRQGDIG